MTCGAVLSKEQVAPLLDPEKKGQRPGGYATDVMLDRRDPIKVAAERGVKFILRGLLILLGLYLFDSMKRYAINYTGEDTWFTTFVVIVVAVPIAETFCVLGQALVEPMPPHHIFAPTTATNGNVPKEEIDALFPDLEKGSVDYTKVSLQADLKTEIAAMADAHKETLEMEAARMGKCIVRGLFVLLWVYLVYLLRRYVNTHGVEEIFFTLSPLIILYVCISGLFCFLMESFGESIFPLKASY